MEPCCSTNRAAFLIKDWLATNPRSSKATLMAWNDMAAGWRASVLACAVGDLGRPTWLLTGLKNHGTALADPAFYVDHGNHALNQVIGLLDVACVLGSSTWKSLSASRVSALVLESVDSEGASNEQAIGYQLGAPKATPVWGPNVWVESAGLATFEAEVMRDLYAAAATERMERDLTAQ